MAYELNRKSLIAGLNGPNSNTVNMKKLAFILILSTMSIYLFSQNMVYDSEGTKKSFISEDIDILFANSEVTFPEEGKEFGSLLIGILPTVVDIGFQITTNILENRAKKFSAEYSKHKSYLQAGERHVPNFTFIRTLVLDKNPIEALSINILADPVAKMEGFVYYINSITLVNSSAKAVRRSKMFDYTIEIKPTLLLSDGEKKVIELSPIAISSVKFGENLYPKLKHRTDIIAKPANAVMTEISLKIVETNPKKVRAEKILSVWNAYKDNAKTIVNNYLPKEEESENANSGTGNEETKPAGIK